MPAGLRDTFRSEEKTTPIPTPQRQIQELPPTIDKGKAREQLETQHSSAVRKWSRETSSSKVGDMEAKAESTIWMGIDTPFKSANSWFVEPGRSNRSRQEGTSLNQTLTQDILVGIATPQPSFAPTGPAEWEGRETPPHLPSRGRKDCSVRERDISLPSRRVSPQLRRDVPSEWRALQQPLHQDDGGPPDDESNGDPPSSHKSSGSRRRHRQSRTPRPGRRQSSTPRPRRPRRDPDNSDGGGGSGDESSSSDSSWSSHSSHSKSSVSSRNHRSRRNQLSDDVIIPYGTIPPTIKSELKQEDLPTWDGDPKTAITYFWKVQERATLRGYIPAALGYWLWLKLKEGSDVQGWFSTLPSHEQAKMRGHWIDYLRGIKEGYLGRQWQFDIGEEYKAQHFREPGHENELPKTFIAQRIMYTRMLVKSDNGGPLEVHLVMARAPLAWRTILLLENIKSTSQLYMKAAEHQESLVNISRTKPSSTITTENLVATLRRMGYVLQKPSFHHNFPVDRRANFTISENDNPSDLLDLQPEAKESYISAGEASSPPGTEDQILAEVYQVMKRRQRAPPPGGYMFSKNDHVTTKMG